ncbi:hypothetical protein KC331_g2 [Hortaea werneckii]|nr:hypothetical protein KC331_g2 [Hortaea werneckii]
MNPLYQSWYRVGRLSCVSCMSFKSLRASSNCSCRPSSSSITPLESRDCRQRLHKDCFRTSKALESAAFRVSKCCKWSDSRPKAAAASCETTKHLIIKYSNRSLPSTMLHSPCRVIENNRLIILLLGSVRVQVTIIPHPVSPQTFPISMALPQPVTQSMALYELVKMLDRSIDVLSPNASAKPSQVGLLCFFFDLGEDPTALLNPSVLNSIGTPDSVGHSDSKAAFKPGPGSFHLMTAEI